MAADSRLIHQTTFCDREGGHAIMVAADGGSVFLAATGAGGTAGRCRRPLGRGRDYDG